MSSVDQAKLSRLERQAWTLFCSQMGKDRGRTLWFAIQKEMDLARRMNMFLAAIADVHGLVSGELTQPIHLKTYLMWKKTPVSITEFIEGKYYLDKKGTIYPKVMEELLEINSGKYSEVVCTGGIGSAKTTTALYSIAYQLYLMSCMRNPHELFGLDPSSEIMLVFQSINKIISAASFRRFKDMIGASAYFKAEFMFDKNLDSKLVFPNRIEVVPVSGAETAAIGQNVIGGLIDELNYMAVVDKSKQSVDGQGYDQAVALYNSIARRRKSRFLGHGRLPGLLCLVSSKRYPGQFTDMKEEEAQRDPSIYIYDYRVWDVKPDAFCGQIFKVFTGDLARKPRVLKSGEERNFVEEDQKLIVDIPVEFREEFDKDIINALREIAGVSTLARHPFMLNVEAVTAAFGRSACVFDNEQVDFQETQLRLLINRITHKEAPRYAHIDLAVSGDSCGLAIGHVPEFVSMKAKGFSPSDDEMMPRIVIDGLLEIKPPRGGEILFWKVRDILIKLRQYGMDIRWVSFDSFQSTDSMQLLRQQGFAVGNLSMDTTIIPYETLKQAFYTGRLSCPSHKKTLFELVSLEFDPKKAKVDHPPKGSKDCSDALAGVVHGLTNRREIWGLHKVPLVAIPSSIGSSDATGISSMRQQRDNLKQAVAAG